MRIATAPSAKPTARVATMTKKPATAWTRVRQRPRTTKPTDTDCLALINCGGAEAPMTSSPPSVISACGLSEGACGAVARSDRLRCSGEPHFQQHAVVAPSNPARRQFPVHARRSARPGPLAAAAGVSRAGMRPIAFACPARERLPHRAEVSCRFRRIEPRRSRWLDGVARYAPVDASPVSSSCLKRRRSSAT